MIDRRDTIGHTSFFPIRSLPDDPDVLDRAYRGSRRPHEYHGETSGYGLPQDDEDGRWAERTRNELISDRLFQIYMATRPGSPESKIARERWLRHPTC